MNVLIGFLIVHFLCFLLHHFLTLVVFVIGGFLFELLFVF